MGGDKAFFEGMVSDLEREFERLLDRANSARGPSGAEAPAGKSRKDGKRALLVWVWTSKVNNLIATPIIYGMIFPLLVLDASVSSYQAICFRLLKIPRVKKSDYIALERHNLGYLNPIEKFNCDYCGYANGLVAFTREVLARTEQYFCPIKHARSVLATHERYVFFLEYGEAEDYRAKLKTLREALANEAT